MKKSFLLLILLAIAVAVPAKAQAARSAWTPTFVSIATFTPPGSANYGWSFQNTSSAVDVRIERIDIFNCSSSAVSGGIAKFDLYMASAATAGGSTLQVSTYAYDGSSAYPANVTTSTGPVNVVLEHKLTNQGSILAPAYINVDEAATTNLIMSYDFTSAKTQPLFLPEDGTRAIVLQQSQVGSTDYTVGCLGVRVLFTAK